MMFQYLGVSNCNYVFVVIILYTDLKNGNLNVNWKIGAVIW